MTKHNKMTNILTQIKLKAENKQIKSNSKYLTTILSKHYNVIHIYCILFYIINWIYVYKYINVIL